MDEYKNGVEREIGRLAGRMDGLEAQMEHLQTHADETQNDMKRLLEMVTNNKARLWLLGGLTAGGGAVGAMATKVASFFSGGS